MNTHAAKLLAERIAAEALSLAEGDFMSAHRVMVRWAERDPELREAIRIYVEALAVPDDCDC